MQNQTKNERVVTIKQYNLLRQEIKRSNNLNKIKRYCKHCGHSQYIPVFVEYQICTYCNHKIYHDGKTKFKLKLGERLDNEKK